MTIKTIKTRVVDIVVHYWAPMLSCIISFGLSLMKDVQLLWRIFWVMIPWIVFCLIVSPFLNKYRKREMQRMVESKSKDMPQNMVEVQKIVDDFIAHEEKWTNTNYSSILNKVCDKIRDFYILKGNATVGYDGYSVSIKEIQGEDNNRLIREVCRDNSTISVNRKITALDIPYPLNENTPFQWIVDKYEKESIPLPYIESDVHEKIKKGEYKCTRCKLVGEANVPYQSICVSPILPLSNPQSQNKIRGFLCVDSEATNCFSNDKTTNTIYHEFVSGVLFKMMEIQGKCVNN